MAPPPSKTLEINLISVHYHPHVSKHMKTYAIAWVQQDRKLSTRTMMGEGERGRGRGRQKTRTIKIYTATWVRDALIGQVKVFFRKFLDLDADSTATNNDAAKPVALQIHRPSGRPQGILKMEPSLDCTPLLTQNRKIPLNQFRSYLATEDNTSNMVNGNSSLCSSDVIPSASVVAVVEIQSCFRWMHRKVEKKFHLLEIVKKLV
ncbi:uncharacterized protein LOC120162714 [Hibiscus syriacus]|uniref:uncharacterized protein LOC120162714 n=1 Tax=Hibiscus syriacus TaxID=106335 RepID=UPI001925060E|nr:uncharacterized protein LOC120162714 [Hibiscus syriacus]